MSYKIIQIKDASFLIGINNIPSFIMHSGINFYDQNPKLKNCKAFLAFKHFIRNKYYIYSHDSLEPCSIQHFKIQGEGLGFH